MNHRFHRPRGRRDGEERILPLVNIVFLLLIFFMLAGQLSASDPFEVAPTVSASRDGAGQEGPLLVISADRRIALNGIEVTAGELTAELLGNDALSGGASVRVKADGGAEARHVIDVIRRLRAMGAERIDLLTVAGPGR